VNARNNTKFLHSTLIKCESGLCRTKRDEWMNGRKEWEYKAKKKKLFKADMSMPLLRTSLSEAKSIKNY